MSPSVWTPVNERESTNQDGELYSSVADLYHDFRPQYPEKLMNATAAALPKNAQILEIGSGPATATLPLLQRGFNVTCIEPGSGMIEKAKQVCRDYQKEQVQFHHSTIQDFLDQTSDKGCYDAILAATSFHWVMDSEGIIVEKCHSLLKPNGKLILLWNIPPEPDESIRDAVATATSRTTPFYFGGYSVTQHVDNIQTKLLQPIHETGLFTDFSWEEYPTMSNMTVSAFLSLVRTFSPYIRMTEEEREIFLEAAEKIMTELCGSSVDTTGLSILNVATKISS